MLPEKDKQGSRSWPRILGEAAAIVISILLAFAIDAWWEQRALGIEEQQVLQGLHEEFVAVRDVLSEHLSVHKDDLRSLEEYLSAVENDGIEDPGPIVDAVVLVLMRPMTSDLGSGTLDALLSSGRIEILAKRSLRAKLASWEGVIGEVWDDQASNAKLVYEVHIPYFLAEGIPAGSTMHHWYDEWPLPRKSVSGDPDMVSRIINDETIHGMATIQYAYKTHTVDEFEIAMDAVDAILSDIDSSIH